MKGAEKIDFGPLRTIRKTIGRADVFGYASDDQCRQFLMTEDVLLYSCLKKTDSD